MSPLGQSYIQPSQSTEQGTPRDLFDGLWDEVGGFDMDVACTPGHYTARRVLENGGRICVPRSVFYTTPRWLAALPYADPSRVLVDGLAQPWWGKVWLQPPYGLALRKWTAKAVHEVECGHAEMVMALVPTKTDTIWWQEYVLTRARFGWDWTVDAHEQTTDVRFIKGRLTFDGYSAPAGHASAIVVWRR